MSLKLEDHFSYNEQLGMYDFTDEKPTINLLRELPYVKEVQVDNQPITIIAFNEYGEVSLWWVIAVYNNIVDVTNLEMETLRIPSLNEVRRALR